MQKPDPASMFLRNIFYCKTDTRMDETVEVKREPNSDNEADILDIKQKEQFNEDISDKLILKGDKIYITSVHNEDENSNMKEEDIEFSTPLACVEVKYEILENVGTSSLLWSRPPEADTPPSSSLKPKRHTCNVCGKEYRMLCHLKTHILIHTGEKPYLCSVCGKSFRLSTNLKMHSLTHTGEKPHVCEKCGRAFAKRADMKQHFLTHTTELPHKCSLCGKAFRHALSLKVHTRTHTGEKPYICKMCDRHFLTPSHLKTHILTHTGEKPYVCSTCGKGFFTNKDLKRHHPIHSRDKPYVCSVCGKGFCQKSQLEPHMLKKHSIETTHFCKICEKSFTGIKAFRVHSQSHPKNSSHIQLTGQ
ncbi:zinc finger protein 782-like isoform X1 [Periplaneta americana]|uniref:zinc finger protein 782-like isoform X1 n=2 Tax=Periplaneta americana TaxID=6978 RepID=UPI0037E971BD